MIPARARGRRALISMGCRTRVGPPSLPSLSPRFPGWLSGVFAVAASVAAATRGSGQSRNVLLPAYVLAAVVLDLVGRPTDCDDPGPRRSCALCVDEKAASQSRAASRSRAASTRLRRSLLAATCGLSCAGSLGSPHRLTAYEVGRSRGGWVSAERLIWGRKLHTSAGLVQIDSARWSKI